MKYLKMLGLLAVAAAALMAFAGSASATLQTTTGTNLSTEPNTTVEATAGTAWLTGTWSDVECHKSYAHGHITTNHTKVASGPITTLHFSDCNYEVTVENPGSLVLEGTTVKSVGAVVIVHTSIGTCEFATGAGVTVGTLEDSHVTGATAKLNINNSKIPVTGGSFFCGSTGEWEGSYTIDTPDALYEV